jgi:hypothetical protein
MAKGDFGGKRNTAGFDKKPENINKTGANRKSISSVTKDLKAKGYEAANKNDIVNCYLTLVNIDLTQLKDMIDDENQPAMIRIVGKAIMSGKGFDVIEKVLDRGIGKAQNNTDITSGGDPIKSEPVQINFVKTKEEED